ncbi:MAG: protoporphyrinogen oxidase [Vicinamibacteria bacterium]
MSDRCDVAIVGGGVSGLAAALALTRAGVPFLLLESSPRWGGRILSERAAGFLIEGGPDSLFVQKPAAIELCRELGLGDRLLPARDPRTVFVVKGGRMHALPPGLAAGAPADLRAFLTSDLFSWTGKLRMGLERVIPRRRGDDDESIGDFFRRRLGREALELMGDPLLAGIHAGDPERLSLTATMPRLAEIERRSGSLARGLGRRAAGAPAPLFYTLRGGLGEMADAIVRRLPPGRFRTRSAVSRVARENGRYELRLDDGSIVRARELVLAVPPPVGSRLLSGLDLELAAWLLEIPCAGTATVALGFRREDVGHSLDGHGLLVPRGEGLRTTACTFVSSKYPYRTPDGHVLLRAFVGGVRDRLAPGVGSEELVATVLHDLGPLLGLRGAPTVARAFLWRESMPQMEVGHLARMRSFDERLGRWPGLAVIGAGLRGTGIADAVTEGRRAAEAIVAGQDLRSA